VTTLDAVRLADAAPPGRRPSAGAAVLAVAVPLVFLHIRYQPSVALPPHATLKLQDVAVLAVGVAAVVAAVRNGIEPLRTSRWIWFGTLAFVAWIVVATFYPLLWSRPYAWKTHAVTAVEFGLYAVLAPAVPLLVRRRRPSVSFSGSVSGSSMRGHRDTVSRHFSDTTTSLLSRGWSSWPESSASSGGTGTSASVAPPGSPSSWVESASSSAERRLGSSASCLPWGSRLPSPRGTTC
jgi:hypothetical protein